MSEMHTIEKFLESNSSITSSYDAANLSVATLKTQFRPDKIFPRDDYMKWDMIFNNIDTPHRLARGAVVSSVDRTWLKTELNDLEEFKI